jgi:ParB family chromosome partitioning protein
MRQPLGRGLDAILGSVPATPPPRAPESTAPASAPAGEQKGKPLLVPIERVVAGRGQPRRHFEEGALDELADSIREHGILQPLVVVQSGNGSYELIAGERRLRAAARAGLDKVPVVFRELSRDSEMLELALIENLQREDLGPLERARAYDRLLSSHGLSQEEVAKKVGKSRAAVANTLRLLALPQPVVDAVEQSLVTEGHARAILALSGATRQIEAMQQVVRRGLSVRDTEELVRQWNADKSITSASTPKKTRSPGPVESQLSRALATRVRVRGGVKKGRIEIEYYSQEELARLIDLLSSRESV